ncbi:FadR/GntR family transcriptional regulator [Pseudomonas sp. PDM09]|uniref:FadR/GntR family transcriptional regulator n=1 Tax=Pseudomonas sp. PDM09 TaxID=2769270 RepID=UPI00177CFAAE|nr:GntR family transcriptional regulator [Pseudomonas sp. PDM09]MBD9562255.1 FadR family transcriptional regulator [Pseudomonas sp. PDM09]
MAKKTSESSGQAALMSSIGDDLRLPKLSHIVAGRLRDQIASGNLKAGSMLQPESKLLEVFSVSRPTLREALRILEAEGLISIGRGMRSGATILGPSIQKVAQYANFMLAAGGVTMRDLHQARMFFEPGVIRSLKGRSVELKGASEELRACVSELQDALQERKYIDVVTGTNRFHELLAQASGNKTIAMLLSVLQTISDGIYSINLTEQGESAEALHKNMTKTVSGYDALCNLLEKDKVDEAAAFWQRYMERALDFLDRTKLGERKLISSSVKAGPA